MKQLKVDPWFQLFRYEKNEFETNGASAVFFKWNVEGGDTSDVQIADGIEMRADSMGLDTYTIHKRSARLLGKS